MSTPTRSRSASRSCCWRAPSSAGSARSPARSSGRCCTSFSRSTHRSPRSSRSTSRTRRRGCLRRLPDRDHAAVARRSGQRHPAPRAFIGGTLARADPRGSAPEPLTSGPYGDARRPRRERETRSGAARERRREELLDVADRVIQRRGVAVSMDEIASEAGITKPVLYRHFGDKDGLYQALTERYIDELKTALKPATEASEPRDRLAAAIDAYLVYVEREPERYRFLLHASEQPRTAGIVADFRRRHIAECAFVGRGQPPPRGHRPRFHRALGRVRLGHDQGGGNLLARGAIAAPRPARRLSDDDSLGGVLLAAPGDRREGVTGKPEGLPCVTVRSTQLLLMGSGPQQIVSFGVQSEADGRIPVRMARRKST